MPQLSDLLADLSEQIDQLSERSKAAEEQAADVRSESRDELERRISEVNADAQRRRDEIQARLAELQDDLSTRWSMLGASVSDQFDKVRRHMDERRDDHDAEVAERRARRTEANANVAIDFAMYVVAEAEASFLEAAEARVIADELR